MGKPKHECSLWISSITILTEKKREKDTPIRDKLTFGIKNKKMKLAKKGRVRVEIKFKNN